MVCTVIYTCFAETICPLCDLSVSQLCVACSVCYYIILHDNINSVAIKNCSSIGET